MEGNGRHPPLLEFRRLIPDAVSIAMRAADSTDFLRWMREYLLAYASPSSPVRRNPNLARALAFSLTRAVWNGLPVNSFGTRPVPMREPSQNDVCPCGSGVAFRLCCHELPPVPLLTPDALWPYVLAGIGASERHALLQSRRISHSALIEFAAHLLEHDRHGEVVAALEPRLRTPARYNDEDTAILLDLLCEAYSPTDAQRRLEFLEWTTQNAPRSPLRAEAWQRLTSIYLDHGDATRASDAFQHAQQDNPQGEALCVLEIELLVAQRELDAAKVRARFWLDELQASGTSHDDPRIEFLQRMSTNPLARREPTVVLQEEAQPLRHWLTRVKVREPPLYALACAGSLPGAWLVAPPCVAQLEQQWRRVFPLPKPSALHDQLFGSGDVWADEQTAWRRFLEAHPESFDSIDILDDLATAIGRHSRAGSRELESQLLAPVLQRIAAIMERACERLGESRLPWSRIENRPALRGLIRLLQHHIAHNDRRDAQALAEKLLRLNPADDHGVREMLAQAGV
jgi:tetratricopeptide (TPR) repeat protein